MSLHRREQNGKNSFAERDSTSFLHTGQRMKTWYSPCLGLSTSILDLIIEPISKHAKCWVRGHDS